MDSKEILNKLAKMGTVLVSMVKGDDHSIGKNTVATVLGINGYKVVDIGVDNSTLDIIQEAQKAKADIQAVKAAERLMPRKG
jgi:methanogenic corrinoid protein MtbC1